MLKIGFDLGFDTGKIVADEDTFLDGPLPSGLHKFPFNILDVTNTPLMTLSLKSTYTVFTQNDKTFLVGEYAREQIYSKRNDEKISLAMDEFYDEKRFLLDSTFSIILTGIGKTVVSRYTSNNPTVDQAVINEDVAINLALPAKYGAKLAPFMIEKLKKSHSFTLTVGKEQKTFKLNINIVICEVSLQAIDALIAVTSDDMGYIDSEQYEELTSYGTTLLLDGGYGTMGIVPIYEGGIIDPNTCDSLEEFTMKAINEEVSKMLAEKGKNFPQYAIEQILNGKMKGQLKELDVRELRAKAQAIVAKRLVQYLLGKYNNLEDIERIVLAGGTCKSMYDNLVEILGAYGFKGNRLVLLSAKLREEEVPTELTIAVGAYKSLCANMES